MKKNSMTKDLLMSGAVAFVALIASASIATTSLYAEDDDDNRRGGYGQGQYGNNGDNGSYNGYIMRGGANQNAYRGGDDDDDDDRGNGRNGGGYHMMGSGGSGYGSSFQNSGFQPIYPLYQKECGSCHFAYQPGLLTQRSWNRVMSTLEDHFGTDASLDANDTQNISGYLNKFAADGGNVYYKYYQKLNNAVARNEAPMRISELPYFVKEHRKIPARIIKQPEIKSLSHCQKCHITADKGIYSERDIMIPGYGRWDD